MAMLVSCLLDSTSDSSPGSQATPSFKKTSLTLILFRLSRHLLFCSCLLSSSSTGSAQNRPACHDLPLPTIKTLTLTQTHNNRQIQRTAHFAQPPRGDKGEQCRSDATVTGGNSESDGSAVAASRLPSLLLTLHGFGGSSAGFGANKGRAGGGGYPHIARNLGFGLLSPDGYGKGWNAGPCCGPPRDEGLDDAKFLSETLLGSREVREGMGLSIVAHGSDAGTGSQSSASSSTNGTGTGAAAGSVLQLYLIGFSNGAYMIGKLVPYLIKKHKSTISVAGAIMLAGPQPNLGMMPPPGLESNSQYTPIPTFSYTSSGTTVSSQSQSSQTVTGPYHVTSLMLHGTKDTAVPANGCGKCYPQKLVTKTLDNGTIVEEYVKADVAAGSLGSDILPCCCGIDDWTLKLKLPTCKPAMKVAEALRDDARCGVNVITSGDSSDSKTASATVTYNKGLDRDFKRVNFNLAAPRWRSSIVKSSLSRVTSTVSTTKFNASSYCEVGVKSQPHGVSDQRRHTSGGRGGV